MKFKQSKWQENCTAHLSSIKIIGNYLIGIADNGQYGIGRELWKNNELVGLTAYGIPADIPDKVSDYFWSEITDNEISEHERLRIIKYYETTYLHPEKR